LILIDTHVWIWWTNASDKLPALYLEAIQESSGGVGLSIYSCWEVAKKIEKEAFELPEKRTLVLDRPVDEWINAAIRLPGLALVPLTPEIILQSTQLPGGYNRFNKDPADQLIIATSLVENLPLMTVDEKITPFPFINLWRPTGMDQTPEAKIEA